MPTPTGLPKVGEIWERKGDKDPELGKPHRHTRDKIKLLTNYLDEADIELVLLRVAEKHPETVLSVICELLDDAL